MKLTFRKCIVTVEVVNSDAEVEWIEGDLKTVALAESSNNVATKKVGLLSV